MPENSVDAVITDPPYGLSFMGKKWDYDVPCVDIWKEALRVLKPGGHLLSFGGTRTYHRLVSNIEDAGFEIRDQIQWLYGSGFPKSMDISKAIDKQAGVEREVIGPDPNQAGRKKNTGIIAGQAQYDSTEERVAFITAPATPDAQKWQGWGTALKPANEPICLARKPISEKTVAANVLKHGTGGLNIDAGRIGPAEPDLNRKSRANKKPKERESQVLETSADSISQTLQGRWPANIILDEQAAAALDEQSIAGGIHSAGKPRGGGLGKGDSAFFGNASSAHASNGMRFNDGDRTGASRFFYVAKASKSERNAGCEGMPEEYAEVEDARLNRDMSDNPNTRGRKSNPIDGLQNKKQQKLGNFHPTVKPIRLMEYLIKLVTPEGGTVLDPFMGSGSTGVAAKRLDYNFIGIELNEEYFEIAKMRIANTILTDPTLEFDL